MVIVEKGTVKKFQITKFYTINRKKNELLKLTLLINITLSTRLAYISTSPHIHFILIVAIQKSGRKG